MSDATKKNLIKQGVSPKKIKRIYNGVVYQNIDKWKIPQFNQFTFTFMGRLGVSKGIDLLIPAAKRFVKAHPNSLFQLITPFTKSPLHQKISKLISEQNFGSQIAWHKNIEGKALKDHLKISNCVLIPSYSEGFCFVAAEAISMGIPIISSNQYALKEVVSGKFIKMKTLNSKAIYESLCLAFENKFDENEVKKFPLEESLKEYLKLYDSIEIN